MSMWKTDRYMRPIHVVSYEEQPGCKIKLCVLGALDNNAETGVVSTVVYYGVNQDGKTVLKWANDQGYQGVVQVRHVPNILIPRFLIAHHSNFECWGDQTVAMCC